MKQLSEAEIAERIYMAIRKKDMSYGELSEKTGISKAMLQRYATGETAKIPLPRLRIIASALDVTPAYLIGWEDAPPESIEDLPQLSRKEKDLINSFRAADPIFQDEAIDMLKRHPRKE